MYRAIFGMILILSVVAVSGCSMTGGQRAASGRKVFASLQAAVVKASETAKGTVALIKLKGAELGGAPTMVFSGGMLRPGEKSGVKTVTGLILTTNGYVVISEAVKPSDVTRVEAWVGDTEYRARIVKSDSQLGMTVLKMEADEPLKALNITDTEDLQIGDWCIGVQPSDEEYDYEESTSVALCRGQAAGRYREFLLDNAEGLRQGSPIIGLSGNVIGIVQRHGRVLSMRDIRDDLLALLGDAAGVKSADEEARKKAWFGVLTTPINKEYARKYGISRSCLWVNHVMKGGPADAAGVKSGDLITRVNGRDMCLSGMRANDFFIKALHPKVGQPFSVTVLRDGSVIDIKGTFAKEPEDETVLAADLGVTVKRIDDGDVVKGNLFAREGVLVLDIKRGSAASVGSSMRSGLIDKGDIITAIGGTRTPDLDTFSKVLEKLRRERKEILLVEYIRGRATGFAALNLKIGEKGSEGGGK